MELNLWYVDYTSIKQFKIPADPLQSIAPKNRTRYNHVPRLTTLPRVGVCPGA